MKEIHIAYILKGLATVIVLVSGYLQMLDIGTLGAAYVLTVISWYILFHYK